MPVNTASGAGYALNLGAVGVVGSFMGMPLDALILGVMAGAVMHGLNPAGSSRHGLTTVITSSLLAGAFSPSVVGLLIHHLDFGGAAVEAELLKPLVPVLIGGAWPWLIPLLSDGVRQIWSAVVERLIGIFGGAGK